MRLYPTASIMSTSLSGSIIGTVIEIGDARYRVGRPFATGSTAQLFPMNELHPRTPSRTRRRPPLALKMALPSLEANEVVAERMAREAALLCSMHHPNIPRGYAGGTWEELSFIVMERIKGQTLAHALRLEPPFTLSQSLHIVQQLLFALNHIHLDPLIIAHRDLKPANIMLTRAGEVFLIDFGLARTDFIINHALATHKAGSLPYQAPEQIAQPDAADIRSDLYSLGAVFYEMLTGRRAFQGVSPEAVREKKANGYVPQVMAHDASIEHGCTPMHGAVQEQYDQPAHERIPEHERILEHERIPERGSAYAREESPERERASERDPFEHGCLSGRESLLGPITPSERKAPLSPQQAIRPSHAVLVEGCQRIIDRSLAADPAHRYQTPLEFMQDTRDVQRMLAGFLRQQRHPGRQEELLLPASPM